MALACLGDEGVVGAGAWRGVGGRGELGEAGRVAVNRVAVVG